MIKRLLYTIFLGCLILLSCTIKDTSISTNPKGVGSITELKLEPINDSLMQIGQTLFKTKCSNCHTMEYKNSGPDVSDLLARRKPEWIMNFLLNKEEMLQRDSLAIYTRNKFKQGCESTVSSENEAFALLEYFRIYQIWLHEFNVLYK